MVAPSSLDETGRNRWIGAASAAVGAGLFSLKGIVIKLAYAEGMGVSQLLTWRMAFALPFYLVIGLVALRRTKQKLGWKRYAAAAGLGLIGYYLSSLLNFWGLQHVTAQLERLILYIYPTMVAILAFVFLNERITRNHLLALCLAYVGVAILFGSEIRTQGQMALVGGMVIFTGAFTYAIYVTMSRSVIRQMGTGLFTSIALSAASIAFLIQSGVESAFNAAPAITSTGLWLSFILATICTVIPSFLIAEAIRRIGPGPMSAISGVGPVVAAWAAVVILHEPFGWPHMAAMAFTLGGVWLLARPAPQRVPELGPPTPIRSDDDR